MSEERDTTVEGAEAPEKELGWAGRMMVDSLRKQGWLAAVEHRAALATDLEEETTTLRHHLAGLERELDLRELEIRAKTAELTSVSEGAQRDRSRLQERIDHLTRELDVRAHTLASAMTRQENLEEKVRAGEATRTRLERELVEHAATMLSLRATLAGRTHQLESSNRALEEARKSSERILARASREKTEARRQCDELTGLLAAREARITELEGKLLEALATRDAEEPPPDTDERVAGLFAELEERDALVEELERALAAQRAAIAKRDANLATLGAPPASARPDASNREA